MGFSLPSWLLLGVILATALVLLSHARRLVRARALLQVELDRQTAEALNSRVAMERQRSELQLLFDLMPAMVWFKDTQNRLLRINRRAAESAGLKPEEMEGRQLEELYPQYAAGYLADDLEVVRSKSPKLGIVEKITDGSGHSIWIHTDKVPYFDPQGNVVGIVVMAQDITERLASEELARLLGSAVEQSKESILVAEANLDEPGPRIIFVNPAFTRMTGYSAEEALGQTPRILQGPKTDRAVMARLRTELQQGMSFEGEVINYRKDGREFLMEWQVAPLRDPAGATTHFVALQRDITVRRRMESQLVQSQKLETVGKLAGGVAHEFNSILTAIIGQAQLLLADLSPSSPLRRNASEINDAAERAADLTRQLLAYGRKQLLQTEILDLNRVLAGLEGTLKHLMGTATEVRVVPNSSLKSIRADPGQVEQIIMNLALNAADAMPDGGTLILETANVTLDHEYASLSADLLAGEFVMLAVSDTGMGLAKEVQDRIFEPFYTTKEVGEGIGLGLSTCYGIAKQSGGHISVYSEVGRGTTFKVYFPQVDSPAPAPRSTLPDLKGGNETILLVEDDPALREMAQTVLIRLGYTVLAASNGLEALRLKQQRETGHVDLLFTDLTLPHMSGKELSQRILALSPYTKVLFTSAYAENAMVHQGVLSAGTALLQKPFTPSGMANKVREMLDYPGTIRNEGE